MIKTTLASKENLKKGILALTIFILTFPKFEPDFTTGLDSPYMWALNYLFLNNYEFLKHLIFPIGILGFLKHPVVIGNNFLYSLVFFSAIKILFIYLILKISNLEKGFRGILSFLLIVIASSLVNIDFAIIGCTALLIYFYWQRHNYLFFVIALLLASLGLFIKSSIGVNSFSKIIVFLVYDYWTQRNIKQSVILSILSGSVFLIVGLALFQSLSLFVEAIWSIFMLVTGYSSALALFPENNWLLLSLFFITIFAIPALFKSKESRFFYIILILPLFLMWKHSILREEATHYSHVLDFSVLLWVILILSEKNIKAIHYIVSILSFAFLFGNLKYIDPSATIGIRINGLRAFKEEVLNHNDFVKKNKELSEKNIEQNRLSNEMSTLIGKSTIDVYPWDFSYVIANNLNWKPRTTLQSGAFSSWLDGESAKNFKNQSGPDFILIHAVDDWNYGRFGSVDGRYMLSDEPKTIIQILNGYSIVRKEENLLLLKKCSKEKFLSAKDEKHETITWNSWVDVPVVKNAIIRAKLFCSGTFIYTIKAFFYKGEALYIDLMLDNGKQISYRIVESVARDGVWINPFIQNPFDNVVEPEVKKVRFRCSNEKIYNKEVSITWESLTLKDDKQAANAALLLFGKKDSLTKELVKEKTINFDVNHESKVNITNKQSYSGLFSNIVPANGFSNGFEIDIDSIWNDSISKLEVEAEVYYNNKGIKNAVLVASLENSEQGDFWMSRKLDILSDSWNYAFIKFEVQKAMQAKGLLKIYVFNPNKKGGSIFIDDLRVTFIKQQ